ncbi:MAG TPA: hypothetical protein PLK90_11155 [Clostridiales bacterium]|nr:hypothetical protein [Clostridiales bacterium]HQP70946.1 hypothetical protein [Clostridiales bacterium]
MKKLLLLLAISAVSFQFFSCSTDYSGSKPKNQEPVINVYETSDITSSKKTKIQWYGNDIDGSKLTYFYTVTTDTVLNTSNVLTAMPLDGLNNEGKNYWTSTERTYAYISMPYGAYPNNDTPVHWIDSLYIMTGEDGLPDSANFKAVYSKFFVIGQDENGEFTSVSQKIFRRTNRIPKYPMIFSSKLGINGFDQYWMTVGSDSAQMVLREATSFWKPFDFKWMGEDPDGTDVDLEFKWQLWERKLKGGDSIIVVQSAGWSINNLSRSFDDEIFDHNRQGKYSFKVYVRDDAFEESENHATVNFEVFAPQFDKGILLIDDTEASLYPPPTVLYMGNPEGTKVRSYYETLLRYAGYKPENEATDSLMMYRIKKFNKGTEFIGYDYIYGDDDGNPATPDVIIDSTAVYRGVYDPSIRELTKYRLVIIASDDRANLTGVDFAGTPPYTGYNSYLSNYLDVGGNVFILGSSALMGKLYAAPDQLPINKYIAPFRQIFDANAPVIATVSAGTKEFFNKYFGIYSMIFPEQKTYFTENGTQLCPDHYLADNYDFIGAGVYEHITDSNIKPLRIDSAKVNQAWWDRLAGTRTQKLALKDNGSVFTGVPTFEAYKGEVVYKYQSIYDLAHDDSFSYEINDNDTLMTHYLWCKNKLTGEIYSPVTRRSGTIATRYVSQGDVFRTAFFSIPTYFLDNSDNQVSDMFKSMIVWFDLNNEGGKK